MVCSSRYFYRRRYEQIPYLFTLKGENVKQKKKTAKYPGS